MPFAWRALPRARRPFPEDLDLGQRTRLQVTVLQVDDAPVLLRRQRPLAVVVDVERIGRRLDDLAVDQADGKARHAAHKAGVPRLAPVHGELERGLEVLRRRDQPLRRPLDLGPLRPRQTGTASSQSP